MSNYCPVCDAESDLAYKCHRCGKPFDGDNDSSGAQSLRPDGGERSPKAIRDDIRAYLKRRRAKGNSYVKATQVADAVGTDTTRAGANLRVLDGDAVEVWNSTNTGTVWKITLEPEVSADGGQSLESLSTHDLVGRALAAIGDDGGCVARETVIDWVTDRVDANRTEVSVAIRQLQQRGLVYDPTGSNGSFLRRTNADDPRWSR